MWFLTIFLILILVSVGVSAYMVWFTLYPKVKAYDATYRHEVDDGQFTEAYFNGLPKEEIYVQSDHNYSLHGIWIPIEESKATVIIVHGYSFSLFGSIKYVPLFRDLGYNVLVYDHRFHGLSGGANCTFGALEKDDLIRMIDFVMEKVGEDAILGIHGESLGGATSLMAAAEDDRVDFLVSDCAFARMDMELAHRLKEDYRLPAFPVIPMASVINFFITGFFYNQVSPLAAAGNIEVPTMIIHGRDDDYTPYVQGEMIYERLAGPKKLYGVPGATHARSLNQDPETYRSEVTAFLKKHHLLP